MGLLGWAIGFLAYAGYLLLQHLGTSAVAAAFIVGLILLVLAVVPWEKVKR